MRKVHGVNLSPFVRKVRVALIEKGLDYELNPLMPMKPNPELEALNPIGKIPIYEEDGYKLADSSVIIAYLERTHPEPALYPKDPHAFGDALFLEEYADTKLLEATLPFFVQNVINPKFMGQPADEAVLDAAREAQNDSFAYLESRTAESGDGIIGGRFSVADIAIASPMINMSYGGGTIDAGRFPKLAAYVERLTARPSYKALIEEERAGIPG